MGKHGKKQNHHRRGARSTHYLEEEAGEQYPPAQEEHELPEDEEEEDDDEEEDTEIDNNSSASTNDMPSKFMLYQQSVQSPKGDISYLQKFFLMYVGGRVPLHFQEDFCGTALLSAEWLRGDARRTAVGLDLDLEALEWCMENNVKKIGADISSRAFLFHGNVLQPLEARLVNAGTQDRVQNINLKDGEHGSPDPKLMDAQLPARDIVCAFNYSCCCLHTRPELVTYFRHALSGLNKKGGIFVMDLYGGTSSECELRLQRKFPNFTYVWEQTEFDIIKRKTRISLHFNLQNPKRKLRHAFSYSWRLWSLPEIKDCLEEAGFRCVHFWMRQMPDSEDIKSTYGFSAGQDIKYEEVTSFQQQDSWNAYIVGVA
ncbi:PREDICTED: uncharacterized protein LOC109173979 isoform X2 [Ipomoea nil]|uniref:uncharacterized protein LOC109173979 isoform X2 n=1 Tax=Ipomoea nil TaxID=35883 RepID=UPI000901FDEE|nr:PREDICTED: uncharacterized protein LOC109173979 isoform X2 [Ipomoea nil]